MAEFAVAGTWRGRPARVAWRDGALTTDPPALAALIRAEAASWEGLLVGPGDGAASTGGHLADAGAAAVIIRDVVGFPAPGGGGGSGEKTATVEGGETRVELRGEPPLPLKYSEDQPRDEAGRCAESGDAAPGQRPPRARWEGRPRVSLAGRSLAYHATSERAAKDIIRHGLKKAKPHGGGASGVYFTKSAAAAHGHAEMLGKVGTAGRYAIVVFDRPKDVRRDEGDRAASEAGDAGWEIATLGHLAHYTPRAVKAGAIREVQIWSGTYDPDVPNHLVATYRRPRGAKSTSFVYTVVWIVEPETVSKYSEDQPRDDFGRWSDGGGGGLGSAGSSVARGPGRAAHARLERRARSAVAAVDAAARRAGVSVPRGANLFASDKALARGLRAVVAARAVDHLPDDLRENLATALGAGAHEKIARALTKVAGGLWEDWKDDSWSSGGTALQKAAMDEFGLRGTRVSGEADDPGFAQDDVGTDLQEYFGVDEEESAGRAVWNRRKEIVRAIVRAQWETTQWALRRQGIRGVLLYRGVELRGAVGALRAGTDVNGYGYIRGAKLKLSPLQSMTAKQSVAENFASDGDHGYSTWRQSRKPVADLEDWAPEGGETYAGVIRARVPAAAVFSLPAFGKGIHSEAEVVTLGSGWSGASLWFGRAPRPSVVPVGKYEKSAPPPSEAVPDDVDVLRDDELWADEALPGGAAGGEFDVDLDFPLGDRPGRAFVVVVDDDGVEGAASAARSYAKYSEDQPRDEGGRWTDGGGGGGGGEGVIVTFTPTTGRRITTYTGWHRPKKDPPVRRMGPGDMPPPPLGKPGERVAGGVDASGRKNTETGDLGERLMKRLGLAHVVEGKRQGPLDLYFKGTNVAVEHKVCNRERREYKISPNKKQIREKLAFAKRHGWRAASMITVLDRKAKVAYSFWRWGIKSVRLNPKVPKTMKNWKFLGKLKLSARDLRGYASPPADENAA